VTKDDAGFSLIEVVVVTALIALALTLAGPRIGAGLGRLELEQAAQSSRSIVKVGRVQAQRTDQEHYVILDSKTDSVALLDPNMKQLRREQLPSSVQILPEDASTSDLTNVSIAASGIVRRKTIRLRGRSGDLEVVLQ